MALKQDKEGNWLIKTAADLEAAVAAVEDREQAITDLEQEMEEQYDYLTMREEITGLLEAIRAWMVEHDHKHVFRDRYKLTLIRRTSSKWNESKLRKLLPKNLWLKVTKQVIDPGKIDDLVRDGTVDEKMIAPALETSETKPYVQRYPYKEGQDKDAAIEEERQLREAMANAAAKAAGPTKRRGK